MSGQQCKTKRPFAINLAVIWVSSTVDCIYDGHCALPDSMKLYSPEPTNEKTNTAN